MSIDTTTVMEMPLIPTQIPCYDELLNSSSSEGFYALFRNLGYDLDDLYNNSNIYDNQELTEAILNYFNELMVYSSLIGRDIYNLYDQLFEVIKVEKNAQPEA